MNDGEETTGRQIVAARALLGIGQTELAAMAGISVPDLERLEASTGKISAVTDNVSAVLKALQSAGISFIDDNQTSAAGGPGVRLSKSPDEFDTDQTQTVQYKEYLAPNAPTGTGG